MTEPRLLLPTLLFGLTFTPIAPVLGQSEKARAAYNRGNWGFRHGDYEGAVTGLTEAIERYPDYAYAFADRGWVRFKAGDHDGALKDLTTAIELAPNSALVSIAYVHRACVKLEQGDTDGAIEDCSEAIRLTGSHAAACSVRGYAREAKGDLVKAREDFSEAIRNLRNQFPALPDAHYQRRLLRSQVLPDPVYRRGLLRLLDGDTPGAIEDLRRSLETDTYGIYRALWYASVTKRYVIHELQAEARRLRAENDQKREALKLSLELGDRDAFERYLEDREPLDQAERELRREEGRGGGRSLWEFYLATYYQHGSAEGLLKAAQTSSNHLNDTPEAARRRVREAHFYIGLRLDFAGNREEARVQYAACLEQGRSRSVEYRWAKARLSQWDQE